jgi:hypothetical protein
MVVAADRDAAVGTAVVATSLTAVSIVLAWVAGVEAVVVTDRERLRADLGTRVSRAARRGHRSLGTRAAYANLRSVAEDPVVAPT